MAKITNNNRQENIDYIDRDDISAYIVLFCACCVEETQWARLCMYN